MVLARAGTAVADGGAEKRVRGKTLVAVIVVVVVVVVVVVSDNVVVGGGGGKRARHGRRAR